MAIQALMQALGRNLGMAGSAGGPVGGMPAPEILPPMRFEVLDALPSRPDPAIPVARRPRRVAFPAIRWLTRARPVPSGSVLGLRD